MAILRGAALSEKLVFSKLKKAPRLLASPFSRITLPRRLTMSISEEKGGKVNGLEFSSGDPFSFENKLGESHRLRSLTSENAADLMNSVDAFIFDCDGVIWKGDTLIDGVSEAMTALRSMGKKLVFVTNNSTKSRRQAAKKFCCLGLDVSEEEIFSSSFAAAMYLKLINFPLHKKVYVIGEEGIVEELRLAGYTSLGGPEDVNKTIQMKSNLVIEHDKSVGAVIVGLDKYINYYKLLYATLCIRENLGCLFIATNRDTVGHFAGLQEWPAAGSMVAAICGSVEKEPVVVGKPSTFMIDILLDRYRIAASKMCMVGDRLDTDILFGISAGFKTLLVFSGHTTQSRLMDPSNNIRPDYYTNSVSDITSFCT